MLNIQTNINLDDPEMSDFSDKLPSPNIALNRESENEAKLAALRAEIQLGLDSLATEGGIRLTNSTDIENFMAEFYD